MSRPASTVASLTTENVPDELKALLQWVVWRYEERASKWTKVPYNARTGTRARVSDQSTWAGFDEALTRARADSYDGIGFVFSKDDPYTGGDLDDCLDKDGRPVPAARAIIEQLGSYAEVSPRGQGVKIWVKGRLPTSKSGRRTKADGFGHLEVYQHSRFFTVTGWRLPDSPELISDRQGEINDLYAQFFGTSKKGQPARNDSRRGGRGFAGSDDELVEKAAASRNGERFQRLWHGDVSGYASRSEADLALCSMLAFYTGADPARIDRLFRRSGLYREKWERQDYRERTIAKAIRDCGHFYGEDAQRRLPDVPAIDASDGDLARMADAAWRAVEMGNNPPFLFRRGVPCRTKRDDGGELVSEALSRDHLRHYLARLANWYRLNKEGARVPAKPPWDVVRDMLAHPAPPLPVLSRIVRVPVWTADRQLLQRPGYHPGRGVLYEPQDGLVIGEVPPRPTPHDVAACRKLLLDELLGDFAFVSDAERAHALALLLLPFVRDLIEGPTPLHLIEKPTAGTGAGLLTDVLMYPALGTPGSVMTEGRDGDEWRKRITAKLISGPEFVLLDNLRRPLESAALAAALTTRYWEDRILGATQTVRLAVRCAWVATGNNPSLSAEIARRTVRIRLDTKLEQPWRRSEFRHPNLRRWAMEHRGGLIWAALVLVRAWVAAGRPAAPNEPTLGSYEAWSAVMSGILHTAGIPGFLGNLDDFYDKTDEETTAWTEFVSAWSQEHGKHAVGVADLCGLARKNGLDLGQGAEHSQRSRLGRLLAQQRDRRYGAFRIERAGKVQGAIRWRLVTDGEVREGGEVSPNPRTREGGREAQDKKNEGGRVPHEAHNPHGEPSGGMRKGTVETNSSRVAQVNAGTPLDATPGWDGLWYRWQERAAVLYESGLRLDEAERQAWKELVGC